MLILSIETSTQQSSVALAAEDRIVAAARLGEGRRHGEFVGPAIRFCLDQAGAEPQDITGIAVGTGPGLYTGLRVGIATAQTMAMSLRLPVVGLSGLDVLAFQFRHTRPLICAALDARRKEVFWASYRPVPGGVQRVSDPQVGAAEKLAAEIVARGEECLVVGDGGVRYQGALEDAGAQVAGIEQAWPLAEHLAELAIPRFIREETEQPTDLRAMYLRHADARIGWETRGRMQGGTGDS